MLSSNWISISINSLLVIIIFLINDHSTQTNSFAAAIRNEAASDDQIKNVKPTTTTGMVIDAGSGGSRLHIFNWKPRIFDKVPPPLSYPEANEKWTGRVDPGIHNYADDLSGISAHMAQLIDFAKVALVGFENDFPDYPIYFKATGGMRELDTFSRERIITYVRQLLSDKTFCPFLFRDDFARVISGEEEAIFSWSATNFLMGTLLQNSQGTGEVHKVNSTYGTLDLGGASTQIAFYVPSQDISEGLFKLQLGGQKMWNVYAKSFLQFGIVSARKRQILAIADSAVASLPRGASTDVKYAATNPCFHSGYTEEVVDSTGQYHLQMGGPETVDITHIEDCRKSIKPLMERELGKLCDEVYHGDCSIAGAYQPPVPTGEHGHFIGQSSYKIPWTILQLPKTASLLQFEKKAADICTMNFAELVIYVDNLSNQQSGSSDKLTDFVPYVCFMSGYVLSLLEDGYRFSKNQTLTVIDQVDGHKVGWALGAILFEINELPWILNLNSMEKHPFGFVFLAAVLGFFFGVVAAVLVYRELVEDKRPLERGEKSDPYDYLRRTNTIDAIRRKMADRLGGETPSPYMTPPFSNSRSGSPTAGSPTNNASASRGVLDRLIGRPSSQKGYTRIPESYR